jgi:hypothetical protein
MMLNEYLETLRKEASDKDREKAFLKEASVQDLAEMAGIKLAQHVCPKCGGGMEKQGAMFKCGCGMSKSATAAPEIKMGIEAGRRGAIAGRKVSERMAKTGSELPEPEIIEVGDAAGRLLAKSASRITAKEKVAILLKERGKTAGVVPIDEIRESIQEARERENIPGRARSSAIAGGIGGGIGGGVAGGALGMLAKKRLGLAAPVVGAGLGMLGGGYGGARAGSAYGEEEARADRAVAMLRALKAHQAGMGSGFRAGMNYGRMKTGGVKRPFVFGR